MGSIPRLTAQEREDIYAAGCAGGPHDDGMKALESSVRERIAAWHEAQSHAYQIQARDAAKEARSVSQLFVLQAHAASHEESARLLREKP